MKQRVSCNPRTPAHSPIMFKKSMKVAQSFMVPIKTCPEVDAFSDELHVKVKALKMDRYFRSKIEGVNLTTLEKKIFACQKGAASFLKVKKGAVSAAIIRGGLCQGWRLRRLKAPSEAKKKRSETPNISQISTILSNMKLSPHDGSHIDSPTKTFVPIESVLPVPRVNVVKAFFTVDQAPLPAEWGDAP